MAPVVPGENDSVKVQLEFAGTLPPGKLQVLLTRLKALTPVNTTLLMFIAVEPAFWNVTVCGALVVPTVVAGKVSVVGVTLTAVPFPLTNAPCFAKVKFP